MSAPPLLLTHRANRRSKVALIFLHGFTGNPAKTWGQFVTFVAADGWLADWDIFSIGYTTRLFPDFVGIWTADAPLDTLAMLLYSTTKALAEYRSLAFVAHSMGGLILQRALLDHPDLADRTSHVALYGTPSAGLANAGPFRFLKRQVRDMGRKSDFIRSLRARWTAEFHPSAPFRFMSVAGDQDEFVVSRSSLGPFPSDQQCVVPGDHLEIVRPAGADSLSVTSLLRFLRGEATEKGPRSAAALAIESRDFAQAIRLLENHKEELDAQGAVQLALALESDGRQEEAIAFLESYPGEETNPMGVLAGRLKRRWLAGRRRADAERALDLYRKGYRLSASRKDHAQAFFHGINVAFMELAYGSDSETARAIATEVLDHCALARKDFWRMATEGEAKLILGDTAASLERFRQAAECQPTPREVTSILQQALRLADLLGNEEIGPELRKLYLGDEDAEI